MFNLIYAHLLAKTEHSQECDDVCAGDCSTRQLLEELDAPLMPWEIAAAEQARLRRRELMRGNIPA